MTTRTHLSLYVADLEQAIDFYSRLFGLSPSKVRSGYANFALTDPPLKLALTQDPDRAGQLNHLGIEVETSAQVSAAAERLAEQGLRTVEESATTCCHALQDKVWVHDPDGAAWEVYTVLADAPEPGSDTDCCQPGVRESGCCATPELAAGCCVG